MCQENEREKNRTTLKNTEIIFLGCNEGRVTLERIVTDVYFGLAIVLHCCMGRCATRAQGNNLQRRALQDVQNQRRALAFRVQGPPLLFVTVTSCDASS